MSKRSREQETTEKSPAPTGSFEEAMGRLEGVVKRLESGDLPLEEALTLFEEGVKLTRFCRAKLDEAQGRLEEVSSVSKGQVKLTPMAEGDVPPEEKD